MQPTDQVAWGDWCNVKGTGFGVRPTTDTGNDLADAFVWVKPGGECDVRSLSSILHCSKLTFILGNLRHHLCQIRCSLRPVGRSTACPRSRNLVPGLLRATAHQCQPCLLSLIGISRHQASNFSSLVSFSHFISKIPCKMTVPQNCTDFLKTLLEVVHSLLQYILYPFYSIYVPSVI